MNQNKWLTVEVETMRVNLDDEYWIDIKKKITTGEYEKYMQVLIDSGNKDNPASEISGILLLLITDWNFVDSNGIKLAITIENMRKFNLLAANKIIGIIKDEMGTDNPLESGDETES